jgi:hypothetical protein
MAEQITEEQLVDAVIRPILIERAQVAEGAEKIPILMRYQQDDCARILRAWMRGEDAGGEDHFLTTFAIPHFCRQAEIWAGQGVTIDKLPPDVHNPPVVADFAVLNPGKRALLRRYPYRLIQLSVVREPTRSRCTPQRSDLPNRIPEVIYCERNDQGHPTLVPPDVLVAVIRSSLRTNELITREDRRLLILDLYLDRGRNINDTHYWHSDSGTPLGVKHDPVGGAQGHESLDYASLLMITNPGAITKSTAFTSNVTNADEVTGDAMPAGYPGRVKNMIQFLAKNGTCIAFCDWAVKHATSTVKTLTATDGPRQAQGNYNDFGQLIVQHPTPLGMAMTPAQVARTEAPSYRMFLRTHFVKWASIRYPYTDCGPEFIVPVDHIGTPTIRTDAATKTVTVDRIRDLNAIFGRTGNGQLVQATTKSPYGLGIGGKKTKRNKLRGGNPYENIMIECDVKDYYFFDKTKTGLTVIMD